MEAAARDDRKQLQQLVAQLRAELCTTPDGIEESTRVYAFSPAEVRAIIEVAGTTKERLVVVLFFTTGMRIGGLARLRVPDEFRETRAINASQMPEYLSTVEKNGKVRKVRITDACRVLVARWYSNGRAKGSHRYLFPGTSSEDPARHACLTEGRQPMKCVPGFDLHSTHMGCVPSSVYPCGRCR